jgi:hypothetical protein
MLVYSNSVPKVKPFAVSIVALLVIFFSIVFFDRFSLPGGS